MAHFSSDVSQYYVQHSECDFSASCVPSHRRHGCSDGLQVLDLLHHLHCQCVDKSGIQVIRRLDQEHLFAHQTVNLYTHPRCHRFTEWISRFPSHIPTRVDRFLLLRYCTWYRLLSLHSYLCLSVSSFGGSMVNHGDHLLATRFPFRIRSPFVQVPS